MIPVSRRIVPAVLLALAALLAMTASPDALSVRLSVRADAPAEAIEVFDQTTESRFRQSFVFRAGARSTAGDIVRARIIWTTRGGGTAQIAYPVTITRPAPETSLAYTWNTRGQTTPPWQIIYYRWEVADSAGNVFRTPLTKAEIADNTRSWQQLSDGQVTVYWYDRDAAFGQTLFSVARQGFDHVQRATGHTPDDELRIVMYNDQTAFCSFFAPGACQPWIAGVTFGSITVQWLIDGDERFVMRQVVPHELAHAFLADWMGGRISALPRWFNEGQAVNNELDPPIQEIERARALARTLEIARLPLLDQSFLGERNNTRRVQDWYAQSASLVAFMYERWGLESLGAIVDHVRQGQRFEQALEAHTGLTLEGFELAWRTWLGVTSPPPTLFPTFAPVFPPTPTFIPTRTPSG